MKRQVTQTMDWAMGLAVFYGAMLMLPATLWYEPQGVFIDNSTVSVPPKMTIERSIKRDTMISYHVALRQIGITQPICDAPGGPFLYKASNKPLENVDWNWWTADEPGCWPLTPASYVADTCHTVTRPFWGLVPAKTTCITSNVFTIGAVSPEQAEQAVEQTQELQVQVEELKQELKNVEQQQRTLGD